MDNQSESINRILIPFDMIFDTEVGLIKLILMRYMDEEEFNGAMMDQPDGIIKFLLNGRSSKNPLQDFVMNEEDADYYYNEFISKKYDEILEFSPPTTIAKSVEKMNNVVSLSITIMCSVEEEIEMIDKYFNESVECIVVDYDNLKDDVDLRMYDTIYVKDIEDLYLYESSMDGKNIYMAEYMHNYTFGLEEPVPDVRVASILLNNADLYTLNMYAENEYIVVEG